MQDPWKYLAFPAAGITGYLVSLGITSFSLGAKIGVPETVANVLAIGFAGLIAGFLVDDLIPAYLEKVRSEGNGGMAGGDLGGGDDDFGGDMDFE